MMWCYECSAKFQSIITMKDFNGKITTDRMLEKI